MHWSISAIAGGVGTLYFGAALADILTDWERFRAKMQARGANLSRPVATALVCVMVAGSLFVASIALTSYRAEHPSLPKTVEAAQKFVVGTWVFAQPLNPANPNVVSWQRWVIRDDGSMDIYEVSPASDSWGNAANYRYEVISAKYQDTGQRFYGVKVIGTALHAIIETDGVLLAQNMGRTVAVLERGDKNPFSK